MLVYNYTTEDNQKQQICVELINTPFVQRWVDYLDRISTKCPKVGWYACGLNDSTERDDPKQNVQPLLNLRDSFLYLHKNNLFDFFKIIEEIEWLIANPRYVQQKHLNKWHRYFTSMENLYLYKETPTPSNVNRQEMWQYIQNLNGFTHMMEGYTYCKIPRRKKFMNVKQYSVQFTNAMNLNYTEKNNNIFDPNNIERIEPNGFDFFKESYHYSVWLHEDITGKDQMKAWLDEDDLTQLDITGNLLMTPSVTFDPHMIYAQILNDPLFRKESLEARKPLDRYPLGNILNKDSIQWEKIYTAKFEKITLFGKTLWPKDIL